MYITGISGIFLEVCFDFDIASGRGESCQCGFGKFFFRLKHSKVFHCVEQVCKRSSCEEHKQRRAGVHCGLKNDLEFQVKFKLKQSFRHINCKIKCHSFGHCHVSTAVLLQAFLPDWTFVILWDIKTSGTFDWTTNSSLHPSSPLNPVLIHRQIWRFDFLVVFVLSYFLPPGLLFITNQHNNFE